MALFEEELIKGNSPYKDLEIAKFPIGQSVGFVYFSEATAVSKEYGEFAIWEGVTFDKSATTEDALFSSLELGSLIPNKLLLGKQENGAVIRGELYRIEKKWNKGDTYEGNRTAKGHGFDLFHLKLNTAFLKRVEDFLNSTLNKPIQEAPAEARKKDKPRV